MCEVSSAVLSMRNYVISICCVLFFPFAVSASGGNNSFLPVHHLDVNIDVEHSGLRGVSRISVQAGRELLVHTGRLRIIGIKLNGDQLPFRIVNRTVRIISDRDGIVEISFGGQFRGRSRRAQDDQIIQDVIGEHGVSLTGSWYPEVAGLELYRLRAVLPEGYVALSEAEEVVQNTEDGKTEFSFHFPHPVEGISLIASDRYKIVRDSFGDVDIYAYFFRDDAEHSGTYIEHTKKYLALYEGLIGTFPYTRFSIVENILPTGYSMPTFTLLGRSVVKLPFIVQTSLGHEILHQWFGSSVYTDYVSGNWAEGLTTYLADHLYKDRVGEGWEYRKQMLINLQGYVTDQNEVALRHFTGGVDRAARAIGYGKSAMVFHMLRRHLGEEAFFRGLKDFVHSNRFQRASWDNLRDSFEGVSGSDLREFFRQWIDEKGVPKLSLRDARAKYLEGNFELTFSILQEGEFALRVPVSIYSGQRVLKRHFEVKEKEKMFTVYLSDQPREIVIDEDYDIARRLDEKEYPPVIARILGDRTIVLVLPVNGEEMYRGVIQDFKARGAVIKKPEDISYSDFTTASFLLFGRDNHFLEELFGKIPETDAGFSIMVKKNPWNSRAVIAIIDGISAEEVNAGFGKVSHYGKYSSLSFQGGRNVEKQREETERGIRIPLREEPPSIEVSSVQGLSDVLEGVQDRRIIYVGEVHDVFAHHAVQFDIIRGIHRQFPEIAIGMEMFQRPFQEILDSYTKGDMSEREFLKKSEYFRRWGFDYNLYKPILDYAKTRGIPVVALNIKREIIKKISKEGIGSLDRDERMLLPPDLDFSDEAYRERLMETFDLHKNSKESNFDYFYQSQIVWDETMSQSVAAFLEKNPDRKMVVLAGQGHLKYGSGIPQRTYRRNGLDYAVILIDAKVEKDIGDYVIFPTEVEGETSPKLMVFLKEEKGKFVISGFPERSVSQEAGLETGDIILSLDDVEIGSMDDLKIHLLYKEKGDTVSVTVKRKENGRSKEMILDVTL